MSYNENQRAFPECDSTNFWNDSELDELEAFSQNDISGPNKHGT